MSTLELIQHCDDCHKDVDVCTVGIVVSLGKVVCYDCHYGSHMADEIRSEEVCEARQSVGLPIDDMDEVDQADYDDCFDDMDEDDYADYDDSGFYDTFDSYDEY